MTDVITSYSIHYTKLYEQSCQSRSYLMRLLMISDVPLDKAPWTGRKAGLLILLALCLMLPCPAHAEGPARQPAAVPLTLSQAVRRALDQNPALQQSANQVASGAVNRAQKQADFAPDLHLTLSGDERFDKSQDASSGNYVITSYSIHYTKLYECPSANRSRLKRGPTAPEKIRCRPGASEIALGGDVGW